MLMLLSRIAGAQDGISSNPHEENVLQVVNTWPEISKFVRYIKQSGYVEVLKKKGYYTILAPTNKALSDIDIELKKTPKKLMQGHLFKGHVP